ncbi:hypothetical protein C2142_32430 [Streptomyces sp. CB01881]|nr:hypothetical protein C2142_32430 [Streptomyces sp. CB01881]
MEGRVQDPDAADRRRGGCPDHHRTRRPRHHRPQGGTFSRTDARAGAALQASHAQDPSPAVRKKAGWFAPG